MKIKPLFTALTLSLSIALLSSPAKITYADTSKNKLPNIGISGYSVLSIDKERQIGLAMMRQLRSSQPLIQDPVLIEYINQLGNKLVKNADNVSYPFNFFIVNNNELNAFAFFGGHIGIHSGLITTASTESELASVLAHEISHVTQRHLARRLESQSHTQGLSAAALISSIAISLVNPAVGMAALSATMAATQQASINYTRGNEKEADRVGISLLANSNFDPQGAADFFNKMSKKYRYASKPPAMLLTHPLPDSRISEARQRAHNYPARPLAPSLYFELAKSRIKARYQNDAKTNIKDYQSRIKKNRFKIIEAAKYGLALSYFENKEMGKAQVILEALRHNDKNNLFYVDALTDVYIANNKFVEALAMLSELNLLMPNNQVVSLNYANALLKAKKYHESSQLLQDFLIVSPGNFIAYDLLTSLYREQGMMGLMHINKAEVLALLGAYPKAVDELQTSYSFFEQKPLQQKRIKARILQFQEQENRLKRL